MLAPKRKLPPRKKIKKEVPRPEGYTRSEIRIAELKSNRIDNVLLTERVLDYKAKRAADKNYVMPNVLAEVLMVLVEKVLGMPSWRGYSSDWKDEFRGRAFDHLCRYTHSFNPAKVKSGAVNYFYSIISSAFCQALKKCKDLSAREVTLDPDVLMSDANWNHSTGEFLAGNIEFPFANPIDLQSKKDTSHDQ